MAARGLPGFPHAQTTTPASFYLSIDVMRWRQRVPSYGQSNMETKASWGRLQRCHFPASGVRCNRVPIHNHPKTILSLQIRKTCCQVRINRIPGPANATWAGTLPGCSWDLQGRESIRTHAHEYHSGLQGSDLSSFPRTPDWTSVAQIYLVDVCYWYASDVPLA